MKLQLITDEPENENCFRIEFKDHDLFVLFIFSFVLFMKFMQIKYGWFIA